MQASCTLQGRGLCAVSHSCMHACAHALARLKRHGVLWQLASPSGRWTKATSRIRCSQLHGPAVVLLGDAGHAVTPENGQGCNAAFEDVSILANLLDQVCAALLLQHLRSFWTLLGSFTSGSLAANDAKMMMQRCVE